MSGTQARMRNQNKKIMFKLLICLPTWEMAFNAHSSF